MSRDRRLPRIARAALLALLLAPPRAAAAQQAHLVADLNVTPGGASSEPRDLLRAGDTVYFSAADAAHGRELWKTDGTADGTVLVKDLAPGSASASPRGFTMLHETLFFFADDPVNGTALWRSNGTALGTVPVRAVPGGAAFADGHMRAAGDVLFFRAGDAGDLRLWRSDGTAAHTEHVAGPWPDGFGLWWHDFSVDPVALGNALLFITVDAATDRARLWRTVGTEASTSLVMVADPGVPGPGPALARLSRLGDAAYFTGNDGGVHGLYRTDGTAAGTTLVATLPGQPDGLTAVPDVLLFQLTYAGADCAGCTLLWRSDGTAAGTHGVYPSAVYIDTAPRAPFVRSGPLTFFNGTDNIVSGLWATGETAGTMYPVEALPGSVPSIHESVDLNGTLFFTAARPLTPEAYPYGPVLWRTLGFVSAAPVSTRPTAAYLTPLGSSLLFQGTDAAHGAELWRSDGSDLGTVLLRDIASGGHGSDPMFLTDAGGSLLFLADDGVHGRALWKADGAAAGATLALDFTSFPGTANQGSGQIDWLAPLGDAVIFPRVGAGDAYEMWAVDARGPRQIGSFAWNTAPLRLRTGGAGDALLAPVGGAVYVRVYDPVQGSHLWRCDGASTSLVFTTDGWITVGASDGRHLYFSVLGAAGGIFRSDGTKGGTRRISDAAHTIGFVVANERVFFLDGLDLFVIDDSVAAPRRVATIPTQDFLLSSSFPQAALGDAVFGFVPSAYGGDASYALWKSDGTKEGTAAITALPGSPSSLLVASAGQLFFTMSGAGGGPSALWVSDGTARGTRALPGAPPNVDGLVPLPGGGVIFAAGDTSVDGLGVEPWISDGTAAGTHALQPIGARGLSSLPDQFTVSGGHVFFTADDGVHGRELWALPWSAPTTPATTCACRAPGQEQRLPGGWLPALAALALAGRRRAARRGARIGVA